MKNILIKQLEKTKLFPDGKVPEGQVDPQFPISKDSFGHWNPLHFAVVHGHLDTVHITFFIQDLYIAATFEDVDISLFSFNRCEQSKQLDTVVTKSARTAYRFRHWTLQSTLINFHFDDYRFRILL